MTQTTQTIPGQNGTFLLGCTATEDDAPSCVSVKMTPSYARQLLNLMRTVGSLGVRSVTVDAQLQARDHSGTTPVPGEGESLFIPRGGDMKLPPISDDFSLELDVAEIYADRVEFSADIAHSPVRITSAALIEDDLLDMLGSDKQTPDRWTLLLSDASTPGVHATLSWHSARVNQSGLKAVISGVIDALEGQDHGRTNIGDFSDLLEERREEASALLAAQDVHDLTVTVTRGQGDATRDWDFNEAL